MKQTRKFSQGLRFVILSLLSLIVLCCTKQSTDESRLSPTEQSKNFVSIDDAKQLLGIVGRISKTKSSSGKFAEIETMTQVSDSLGNAIFYAINYQGGGFVLLSADNRTEPVLAFSDVNKFSVEAIPQTGVSVWAAMTTDQITELRRTNPAQTPAQSAMWEPENIARTLDTDPTDRPAPVCDAGHEEHRTVNPLMQTQWHQYGNFNDRVPLRCTTIEQAPVGCLPLAMGQIMKYYEHPYGYNWNLITNTDGGDETSRLLFNIGTSVGIQYTCEYGSGASTQTMCVPGFAAFGYPSAIYASYNSTTVTSELDKGQPVLLKGGQNISGVYTNGHAWVCDGYKYERYCNPDYAEPGPSLEINHHVSSSTMLNMRWGWTHPRYGTPGYNDGWYSSTNFHPSYAIDYMLGMVYNIIPQ